MSAVPQPSPDLPDVSPGIRRSQEAYWRDLPRLLPLRSRERRWVAYHGDERVGFGRTQAELYRECIRRGLKVNDIYIDRLELDYQPPWEPPEVEERGVEPDADEPEEPVGHPA